MTATPLLPTDARVARELSRNGRRTNKRPRLQLLLRTLVTLLLLAIAVRAAIHWLPWFGPTLADGLRAVLGPDAVARLEEHLAKVEDRAKRTFRAGESPRGLQDVSPALPSADPALPHGEQLAAEPVHKPKDAGAMDDGVAAVGDGIWVAVPDPARPARRAPMLFATMLHPDRKRPWAEVFVVAVDLPRVRLHAVAGTIEPKATTVQGRAYARRGLIPRDDRESLLAAFNGGFKAEHGHHGMHVDGVTLLPPLPALCTLIGFENGQLAIATWKTVAERIRRAELDSHVVFWRQAAPCMVEGGRLNPLLRDEESRKWGATLEGNVVIRRSAVGLSPDQRIFYVGLSNDTTAGAMAKAMHHAGASDVLQLDVNWSYPKFLLFPRAADGRRRASTLFKGFLFREDDYIERPSPRDFFYLVHHEG